MPEETINPAGPNTVRPLFLTILCVITFIGSILGIVVNARGYLNAETEVENITSGKSKTQLKNLFSASTSSDELVRIGNLNPENYKKFCIGCIASSILSLNSCKVPIQTHRRAGLPRKALTTPNGRCTAKHLY